MDFSKLNAYCKRFCDLTTDKELLIKRIAPDIVSQLPSVTNAFYSHLSTLDEVSPFIEGKVEILKATHLNWLTDLFICDLNDDFAAQLYHVGVVHVRIKLPSDFMTGAIIHLQQNLIEVVTKLYSSEPSKLANVIQALNSLFGYNLQLMQLSYQRSMMTAELIRFLSVTGISEKLFLNMLAAYEKK